MQDAEKPKRGVDSPSSDITEVCASHGGFVAGISVHISSILHIHTLLSSQQCHFSAGFTLCFALFCILGLDTATMHVRRGMQPWLLIERGSRYG
jgi:thiosulfate reductase cytochrome b subunit